MKENQIEDYGEFQMNLEKTAEDLLGRSPV